MKGELSFNFTLPRAPRGRPVIAAEAEAILLERLRTATTGRDQAQWEVARFYSRTGRPEKALEHLRQMCARTNDPEKTAACLLAMGQQMEKLGDYALAARFYRQAFTLEPTDSVNWYFINNNLGYCLNELECFDEAAGYCREAIRIDPSRANAHKNLGLALQGQGRFGEAAESFVAAVQANASDPRALAHLEALYAGHPEIAGSFTDFETVLKCCRGAVRVAEVVARGQQDQAPAG